MKSAAATIVDLSPAASRRPESRTEHDVHERRPRSSPRPGRPIGSFLGSLSVAPAPRSSAPSPSRPPLERAEIAAAARGPGLAGQRPAGRHRARRPRARPPSAPGSRRRPAASRSTRSAARACAPSWTARNALRTGESRSSSPAAWSRCRTPRTSCRRGGSASGWATAQLLDSMISDGLWDPYKNVHMGNCAEMCAAKYAFTREAQDAFALESYQRARARERVGRLQRRVRARDDRGEEGRRRSSTGTRSRSRRRSRSSRRWDR